MVGLLSFLKARAADPLSRVLSRTSVRILILAIVFFVLFPGGALTIRLFRAQDFPVLLFGAAVLLALSLWRGALPTPRLPRPALAAAALAAAVLLATWAGTWLIFGAYPLSRDELLADFDASFLATGALIAPLPAQWSPFAAALMPQFMLPVPGDAGWLSGYLPGNAALRAIGALTIGSDWTNPVLAAVAIFALYRIGRSLWPDAPGQALVPVMLLATSAQFLTMAMTSYAMTAHLAFNLLWLWCFLRGDRRGDAGAFAAGFVATGLHQLLFHPLFVLPFIVSLWLSGRRMRAAAYVAAYAAIALFWISYWPIVFAGAGIAGEQAAASGLPYVFERLFALLGSMEMSGLVTMAFNLLRFVSWQNILLLPLALLGWAAVRRGEGIARPLAAGLLLTVAAMLILLPWQGHGWGYRYVHGLIGGLCLLAGYGWRTLAEPDRRRGAGVLALGTAASLLVILPAHLIQARDFVAPYRRAHAAIAAAPADIVLVDPAGMLYADDLVRNAPDLSNRPRIMDLNRLGEGQLRGLCRRYRVAGFDRRHGARAGIPLVDTQDIGAGRRALLRRIGCGAPLP